MKLFKKLNCKRGGLRSTIHLTKRSQKFAFRVPCPGVAMQHVEATIHLATAQLRYHLARQRCARCEGTLGVHLSGRNGSNTGCDRLYQCLQWLGFVIQPQTAAPKLSDMLASVRSRIKSISSPSSCEQKCCGWSPVGSDLVGLSILGPPHLSFSIRRPACLIGRCCSCFVLSLYLFLCSPATRFCFV